MIKTIGNTDMLLCDHCHTRITTDGIRYGEVIRDIDGDVTGYHDPTDGADYCLICEAEIFAE